MRVDSSVRPETPPAMRAARAARFVGRSLITWAAATLVAPRLDPHGCARLVQRAAERTLRLLRVEIVVRGARPVGGGPRLLVANHVSWLDVYALNALAGAPTSRRPRWRRGRWRAASRAASARSSCVVAASATPRV